jgi:hypothetical protein
VVLEEHALVMVVSIHQQKGKPKVFQSSQRRGRPGKAQGAWPVSFSSINTTSSGQALATVPIQGQT